MKVSKRVTWFFALAFVMGAAMSVVAHVIVRGPGPFMLLVPWLWSWSAIAKVFGPGVANSQQWASVGLAAMMQGVFAVGLSHTLERIARSGVRDLHWRIGLSLGVTALCHWLLLTRILVATDGP